MSNTTNRTIDADLDKDIKDLAKKLFQDGATLGEINGITRRELNAVYQMGLGFYKTGRFDDAEKVFTFLVMFDHLEPKYWLAAGAVQQVKRNFEKAKGAYVQATMLDIHNAKPQYYAAECYFALGQRDDALATLEDDSGGLSFESLDALDCGVLADSDVGVAFQVTDKGQENVEGLAAGGVDAVAALYRQLYAALLKEVHQLLIEETSVSIP